MRKYSSGVLARLKIWCAATAMGVILSVAGAGPAHAQAMTNTTTLTLTDRSRPVMQAILALISKCGCAITYEDPRYVYQDDLKDSTKEHRHLDRFQPGKVPKVFIPLGGSLQMTLPSGGQIGEQTTNDLLLQLVEAWSDSNQGGGHFQVMQQDGVFHVVPTEVRDRDGNWQAIQSILSDSISLPVESRDDWQTYKAIGRAIAAAAHVEVVTIINGGLIFGGSRLAKEYVLGAQAEAADSVLMRAFKIMGEKRTWFLTYEPTTRRYFLNIDDVSGLSAVSVTPSRVAPSEQTPSAPAAAPPAQNHSAATRNCHASATSPPCRS